MVVKPEELAIPIIDLEPVHSETSNEAYETGKSVYEAFRDVGFAYITNHGLPQELLDQAFEWVSVGFVVLAVIKFLKTNHVNNRAPSSLLSLKRIKTRHRIRLTCGGIEAIRA